MNSKHKNKGNFEGFKYSNLKYDEKLVIGNTKIYIVLPDISQEESDRRWEETCKVASQIVRNMLARGIDLSSLE